jgi:putative ABC transport system substrate-binding protein
MKRREFITLLGGAALAWPLAARAQQGERMRRIGVLLAAYTQSDRAGQARIDAFRNRLQGLGWTDQRNVSFDYRFGDGSPGRVKALASELVQSTPDVIVVAGDPALAELHQLTTTLPIVFTQGWQVARHAQGTCPESPSRGRAVQLRRSSPRGISACG